jgi:hypothetical protein
MNLHRLEIYGLFLAALLAICGTIAYVGQVKDNAKAGTTQQMGEQFRKQLQDDLKAGLASLDGKISAAKTPQAQAQVIREYMPYAVPSSTPAPSSNSSAPPSSSTIAGIPLPDAPSTLIITPDKFPQLLADIKACKESSLKLDACEKQIPVLVQERDGWQRAAKGGSWLSRTKTKLIWLGIGAGAGYALSKR